MALGESRGGCWEIKAELGLVMGTVAVSNSSDVLAKCLCSHFLPSRSCRPGSAVDVMLLPWPQPWGPAWPWANASALAFSPKPCWPQEVQECKGPQGLSDEAHPVHRTKFTPSLPDERVEGRSPCLAGLGPDVRSFPI